MKPFCAEVEDQLGISFCCSDMAEMKSVLCNRNLTRTDKQKKLYTLFACKSNSQAAALIRLMVGSAVKLHDAFPSCEESDEEILSSPVASSYSVKVDVNNIQLEYGVVIPINITPYDGDDYAYDFYLRIFNNTGSQIYDKNLYSYTPVNYLSHTVDVYLNPGTYTIKLINYQDEKLMDTATFTMTGEYLPPSFAKIDDISREVDEEIVLPIRINPNPNEYYAYDFNLDIYDSFGDLVYSENIYSSTMRTNLNYTVDMWLDVGTYTIELTNYTGGAFLDTAILTILDHPTQYATFTISQSGTYYNSKYVTVKLINTDTNLPIKNCGVALKFSNGKTVTVTTNSNGVATY
jgi:hypothetical protein